MADVAYDLKEPASVELDGGRVTASFKAGVVKPRSEQQREALEHLVSIGVATRVEKE